MEKMKILNCLRCEYKHKENGNCLAVGGFCTDVPAAYCQKLQEYMDAESRGGWISVKDRLPEVNGTYQVYAPTYTGGSSRGKENHDGRMYSHFRNGKWGIEIGCYGEPGRVTHWQPLPRTPKECEQ